MTPNWLIVAHIICISPVTFHYNCLGHDGFKKKEHTEIKSVAKMTPQRNILEKNLTMAGCHMLCNVKTLLVLHSNCCIKVFSIPLC